MPWFSRTLSIGSEVPLTNGIVPYPRIDSAATAFWCSPFLVMNFLCVRQSNSCCNQRKECCKLNIEYLLSPFGLSVLGRSGLLSDRV